MIETFAIVAIAVHVEARVAHRSYRIVSKAGLSCGGIARAVFVDRCRPSCRLIRVPEICWKCSTASKRHVLKISRWNLRAAISRS